MSCNHKVSVAALVTNEEGKILRSAAGVSVGDRVRAKLGDGQLICSVEEIREEQSR